MKLQPASKKEIARIAVGTAACAAVMTAIFAGLGLAGIVSFGWPVVAGAVGGSLVAVGNFTLLCLTVQKAAAMEDPKQVRAYVQASYNGRLMLQGAWGVAALLLPWIQPVAALLPLLFPRVAIYALQATGRYKPENGDTPSKDQ